MHKLQLHFNGGFALKKLEIKTMLKVANEKQGLNDTLENLMRKTSLGNVKVPRIKSWATRAGLLKGNFLSSEGEIVWKVDRNLESLTTDWLMHFYLSFGDKGLKPTPDDPAEWGGWTYFIYDFLPNHKVFSKEELLQYCISIFQEQPRIIAERSRYILRAYTETQALAACQFLTQENNQYQSGNPRLPNPYLIGYFLAKIWERDYHDKTSLLTETLLEAKMGLAPVLGITPQSLLKQLDKLETYGIIEQRKAVPPFQIVPRWDDSLTLLQKGYD